MIYALDVQYHNNQNALVACIGFEKWDDDIATYSKTAYIDSIEPYQAGSFYKRELPCLLVALEGLEDIECIIVDGYVWLGDENHAGLGMHLYNALDRAIPIIGVAKSKFIDTPSRCELMRGESKKPLFITSVGVELDIAKEAIASMSGKYRLPTLLKEVDRVCRESIRILI